MSCLNIRRLRTHKVRKLKGNPFVESGPSGRFKFHPKLIKFNREKLNGHIAIKCLGIGPALHFVFISQLFIYRKESIQLIIVNMTILKCTGINNIMNAIKYLSPFALMFLNRYGILFRQTTSCCFNSFLAINPRRNKGWQSARNIFALFSHRMKSTNGTFRFTAYFATDIPSLETLV